MFILGTPHPVWPAQQGRPLQWSRPQQSSPRPLHHLMHRLTTTCRRNPSPGTKKTNKSVKENPKFRSRTQRLGFQREVQPVQLPATASSRWTKTSHHGRLHLQRRQVLTTYPLRCKSSWYLLQKRTLILAISAKKFFDRQHLQGDCLCPAWSSEGAGDSEEANRPQGDHEDICISFAASHKQWHPEILSLIRWYLKWKL